MTESGTTRQPGPSPRDDVAARGTFGLIADPLFGPYLGGKLLASLGIWVFSMVAAVVMWDLTRSALAVGLVSVAQFAPQLLFAPLSGAQADKGNPKAQLFVGRILVAAGGAVLAASLWWGGVAGLPGPWVIVAAAALVGLGFVVGGPAQHSLLPSMVRSTEVSRAVALNALSPIIARAGGPILGTFILVAAGPHWAFGVAAATNLAFGLIILTMPLAGLVERAAEGTHTVRQGLAYLRGERTVTYLLVSILAVGIGADPMITLTPALAASLGHGEALVGALATAFGTGAALSYVVITPVRRRFGDQGLTAGGLGALSCGLLLAGMAPSALIAMVGMGLSGVGFCWGITGTTTRIYSIVLESMRGRIMAVWSMGFAGSRPLSAALSGGLADLTSIRIGFAAVATLVALLGVVGHLGSRPGHRADG